MHLKYLWLIFALLLLASASRAEISLPILTGRVVDNAHIIDASTKNTLNSLLESHEAKTSDQVVVVTLSSLQGYTIEDFGYQLGRKWGIGTKDNNGALFIIAPKERKTRIEVGYGLEGALTDALSKIIIENDVIPSFKDGNYNEGILSGTQAIIEALGGTYSKEKKKRREPIIPSGSPLLLLFFFIPFAILAPFISQAYRNPYIADPDSKGSYGGSSRSGGGYSGGGGSFGGGGASGGW